MASQLSVSGRVRLLISKLIQNITAVQRVAFRLLPSVLAADSRVVRRSRIVSDRRPVLLRRVLIIPPSQRQPRIIGRVPQRVLVTDTRTPAAQRARRASRATRITSYGR